MQIVAENAATTRPVCHNRPHSFAAQLRENAYDIRAVQQLFGNKDVTTTRIYAHDGLTICNNKAYADLSAGVLYWGFATQRCYEDTIYPVFRRPQAAV